MVDKKNDIKVYLHKYHHCIKLLCLNYRDINNLKFLIAQSMLIFLFIVNT